MTAAGGLLVPAVYIEVGSRRRSEEESAVIKDNSKERRRALVNWLGCVVLVFCCGPADSALAEAYPARPFS